MKMTLEQLKMVREQIEEWTDYEVEPNGYRDYQVTPFINNHIMSDLLIEVNKILSPKRRHWWQFWR